MGRCYSIIVVVTLILLGLTPSNAGAETLSAPLWGSCTFGGLKHEMAYAPEKQRLYMDPWLGEARVAVTSEDVNCMAHAANTVNALVLIYGERRPLTSGQDMFIIFQRGIDPSAVGFAVDIDHAKPLPENGTGNHKPIGQHGWASCTFNGTKHDLLLDESKELLYMDPWIFDLRDAAAHDTVSCMAHAEVPATVLVFGERRPLTAGQDTFIAFTPDMDRGVVGFAVLLNES